MKDKFRAILDEIEKDNRGLSSQNINSRILLVDGLNNYIRIWVIMPTVNEDGTHVGGIVGFLQTLGLAIRTLRPTRLIVTFDGKGGSLRRRKLYPQYKQNRGRGVRLNRTHNWADDAEESKQMMYQLMRVIKYLSQLPCTVISVDNIEADDTIGYICELCRENDDTESLFIMSSDKDFYQLVDKKIKIWNPVKKKMTEYNDIINEFNIQPYNFLLFKAMNGDSSDNLPKIKGIGKKTGIKNFPLLTETTQYSTTDVLKYAQEHQDSSRLCRILLDNSKQYELNYILMRLAGGNISKSAALHILDKFNSKPHKLDHHSIQELVLEDKLWSSFPNINSWVNLNFARLNFFAMKNK